MGGDTSNIMEVTRLILWEEYFCLFYRPTPYFMKCFSLKDPAKEREHA